MKDLIDEFHNLMRCGLDEVAVDDMELAEEYFSDACYVLNQMPNKQIAKQLEQYYTINPRDFAI
jgi:hypothetical protein